MIDHLVLPEGLPVPVDDGLCDHLAGMAAPALTLQTSQGRAAVVAWLEARR